MPEYFLCSSRNRIPAPPLPMALSSLVAFPSGAISVFCFRHSPLRMPSLPPSPLAASSSPSPPPSSWTQVIDPTSGQPYYWNTRTNETSWELPKGWMHAGNVDTEMQPPKKLPLEELTSILLTAMTVDSSRFGDVANQYRPQCFEDEFFEYLASTIETTDDHVKKDAIERLRARLSNPLLKNPPPY